MPSFPDINGFCVIAAKKITRSQAVARIADRIASQHRIGLGYLVISDCC